MLADKGAYNINKTVTISHGGTDGSPVTIMGADSAGHAMDITVNGTRNATWTAGDADGNQVFRLLSGADNLKFAGMDFNNVGTGFCLGGNLKNVTIQNMEADNVRYFISNYASGGASSASVNGLTVKDVEVHGFSKSVVLLKYDTHNVTIDNVYGDSEYQDGDHFAMGILLDGSVHDVIISNSTMKNAIGSNSTGSYWNGDGFTAESGVYNLTFKNCVSSGNADGGFDLKSTNTLLVNCTAEDNKRNFRLWDEAELDNCKGIDPHLRGGTGSQDQIWVGSGAHVKVVGGSFTDSGSNTKVVYSDGGTISFNDTSFSYASTAKLTAGSGISGIDGSLLNSIKSTGSWSTTGEQHLSGSTSTSTSSSTDTSSSTADSSSSTTDTSSSGSTSTAAQKTMNGTSSNDTLAPTTDDHWTINAKGGNDKITTLGGNDKIFAAGGNDLIKTGAGNDYIHGGSGADTITGGAGADLFVYKALFDSKPTRGDLITDFAHGVDKLDLSGIDANAKASGNNAFDYLGEASFTGHAGELRVDHSDSTKTVIQADVNGDKVVDFAITLTGHIDLTHSDFIF